MNIRTAASNVLKKLHKPNWKQMGKLGTPRAGKKIIFGVLAGVVIAALFYVAQNSQAVLFSRSVRVKQDRLDLLEKQNAQLRAEIASLTLPSTIETRARALGLGPAKSVIYSDLPQLDSDIASVLPAFNPSARLVRERPDLVSQFGLWWESIKLQLGLTRGAVRASAGE